MSITTTRPITSPTPWRQVKAPTTDEALLDLAASVLKGLDTRKGQRKYAGEQVDIDWGRKESDLTDAGQLYAFTVRTKGGERFEVTVTRS